MTPTETEPSAASAPRTAQIRRLGTFIRAVVAFAAFFAALLLAGGLVLRNQAFIGASALLAAFMVANALAYRLVAKQRVAAAANVVAYSVLATVVSMSPLVPFGYPALAVAPLLAVTVALPHVGERPLVLLLALSLLSSLAMVLYGVLAPPVDVPAWFRNGLLLSGFAACIVLVLFLLWQHNSGLRHTLAILTESESKARTAVRHRDDFLSVAAHELRTPLTAIKLQVAAMNRALVQPEPSKLLRLERQVDRMASLVNDLLDVTRVTSGRFSVELEQVDLGAVTDDVVTRLKDSAAKVGSEIAVQVERPCYGMWDVLRLDQVVSNLVGNAIKYGEGKPIQVSIASEPTLATLRVCDHGIGIPPADQARIFERFERAASSRHYGGLGLGLWIARHAVLALRGTIGVTSEPGQGSTFVVTLPKSPSVHRD